VADAVTAPPPAPAPAHPERSAREARAEPKDAPKKKGVLLRRILFGAVLLAISCGLLLVDWKTGTSFGIAAMVAFAMVFGLRELFRMLRAIAPIIWPEFAYAAGFAVVAVQLGARLLFEPDPLLAERRVPAPETIVIALYALVVLAFQLRGKPSRERLVSLAVTLFGAIYLMLLGSFVLRVRYLDEVLPRSTLRGAPNIGYAAVLYLILAAKGTDMFAFFVGRFLGKRKLIPEVSPGKTWAGAVGGLAGSVLITCLFSAYSDLGRVFHWTAALPFGILVGLSAQAGDLVESMIKRGTAVKDSGGLVPEFGGVLDIIDCILFVAPTIYVGALLLG
jgi:phosphatidate cytidylyltransferase